MKCAVANCDSENKGHACDISFFSFPTDEALIKKWLQFCRRGNSFNPKSSFVCMKHFTSEDIKNNRQFEMGFAKKRLLKPGAVPTIYTDISEIPVISTALRIVNYDNSFPSIDQLVAQLEALKEGNKALIRENKRQGRDLAAIQHKYEKRVYEVEQLRKRLKECENICTKMESKLQSVYMKGQAVRIKRKYKILT